METGSGMQSSGGLPSLGRGLMSTIPRRLSTPAWRLRDYACPEQGIPVVPSSPWEYCVGEQLLGVPAPRQEVQAARNADLIFCETIGLGGNLLFDIGPMEDGTIPPEQVERLERLGEFIKGNEEAVYPTGWTAPRTLLRAQYTEPRWFRDSSLRVWLPVGPILVKGIHNQVKNVSVLKSGERLQYDKLGGAGWLNIPGILWIDLPEKLCDAPATVIKVELEGALNLYREEGSTITDNV